MVSSPLFWKSVPEITYFPEYRPNVDLSFRCIGFPQDWVIAHIFDENNQECKVGQVGRLGVSAPTLAKYWNHHDMDKASWIGTFFLTGDLAYRDEAGSFYHVDRLNDAVLTDEGTLYSALAEEILLDKLPDITECAIISDSRRQMKAVCFLCYKEGLQTNLDFLKDIVNTVLA